jgi:hypothetical protein
MTKDEIDRLEVVRSELSEFIAASGEKNLGLTYDGQKLRATVIVRTTPKVNLPKLRRLDFALASKITKEVVDTERLNESLDAGLWTPELRDEVITMQASRPWIRFDKDFKEEVA